MGPLGPMGPTLLKPFRKRPHLGPFSILRPHPKQKATKLMLDDNKLIYFREKNIVYIVHKLDFIL